MFVGHAPTPARRVSIQCRSISDVGIERVRLPPYHCELNPIELAWSSVKQYVKMNNTSYKLPDVKRLLIEGVERVSPDMWKNFISHVIKEEEKLCEIDFITDEMLDAEPSNQHVLTITGNTSDSESDDSDDEQLT